jgi:hypothetical protein
MDLMLSPFTHILRSRLKTCYPNAGTRCGPAPHRSAATSKSAKFDFGSRPSTSQQLTSESLITLDANGNRFPSFFQTGCTLRRSVVGRRLFVKPWVPGRAVVDRVGPRVIICIVFLMDHHPPAAPAMEIWYRRVRPDAQGVALHESEGRCGL